MRFARRLIPCVVTGALLLAAASAALAAPAAHHHTGAGGFAYGKVSGLAANGSSFTLTPIARSGSSSTAPTTPLKVTVSTTTKEQAAKGTTGPLTNGDYAVVIGARSTGAIAATRVIYSTTALSRGPHTHTRGAAPGTHAAGVVTASKAAIGSTPGSLTIKTAKGAIDTFQVTSATKFYVNRTLQTAAPTLATNGTVHVVVRYHTDATSKALVADTVTIRRSKSA